jgi:hypothetical protein
MQRIPERDQGEIFLLHQAQEMIRTDFAWKKKTGRSRSAGFRSPDKLDYNVWIGRQLSP